jgi:hypothetical protein
MRRRKQCNDSFSPVVISPTNQRIAAPAFHMPDALLGPGVRFPRDQSGFARKVSHDSTRPV